MRNCVLTMMGEMIIKVLSKDDIDDKLKSARDDFLDNLEVTFSSRLLEGLDIIGKYRVEEE